MRRRNKSSKSALVHACARYFIRCLVVLVCNNALFAQMIYGQAYIRTDSLLELTTEQADSLFFRFSHHYTINYNFIVKADSFPLVSHETDIIDTSYVYKGDRIAVASISQESADTAWIKVFRDQPTMGWVTEEELLNSTVPDDEISQLIDYLVGHQILLIAILSAIALVALFFWKVSKAYSLFLLMEECAAVAVFMYVKNDSPEYLWEYYFHPTFNPFILPVPMMVLLSLGWLLIITITAYIFVFSDHVSSRQ